MCPDVLQFLSYMAGRTERVQLGSMVVVLPWHDPMRVAEEVSMLDNLSGGRLILGLGRGAGKVEFDGFRLSMDESRARFVECARDAAARARARATASTTARSSSSRARPSGPRRSSPSAAAPTRPRSRRSRCAIMAKLGVGILIIPQKPWTEVAQGARGVPRALSRGERRRRAAADLRGLDLLRRERRPRRARWRAATSAATTRRVLDHYQFEGDHLATDQGLRVLRQDGREDPHSTAPTPSSTSS